MDITTAILLYVVLLVSLVVHEAAHATFAYLGGDDTAYQGGQVTLNPIPHMQREPFGTIILPITALIMSNGTAIFGFAHAPVDPLWARLHPKRAALMSAAGPLSNLLLAALAFLIAKTLIWTDYANATGAYFSILDIVKPLDGERTGPVFAACRILSVFLGLNLLLAVLNLMPVPPLDGSGIVEGLVPRLSGLFDWIRSQPMVLIACMVGWWYVMPAVFYPVLSEVVSWL